eukprot:m.136443 g.136443  ORF g.136443 m.136443 type:complete len:437 (-) comp29852_c0_seq2:250-1560(-)
MGKKKGSKKKGSKKKSGTKKKTAPLGDPLPSAPERFIQHQLEARAENVQEIHEQRDSYLDETEDVIQQQEDLELASARALGRIREQDTGSERRISTKEEENKISLDGARNEKADSVVKDAAEIDALKRKLVELDKNLSHKIDEQELLKHHQHVLGDQWDAKINELKESLAEIETTFIDNQSSLEKQFKTLKIHFGESLELKLLSTKEAATNAALRVQPVVDKIAYKDNGWLRHELQEQQRESDRVRDSLQHLALENQKLMRELFGDGELQKYSPDKSLGRYGRRRTLRSVRSAPSLQTSTRPTSGSMNTSLRPPLEGATPINAASSDAVSHALTTTMDMATILRSPPKSAMPLGEAQELTIFSKLFQKGEPLTVMGEHKPKRRRARTTPNALPLPGISLNNISPSRRSTAGPRANSMPRLILTPRLHTAPEQQRAH